MKKIILLLLLTLAFNTIQAQFGNGGLRNQRGPVMQAEQKAPEPNFEIEKYMGIVVYNIPKAAKKSNIKSSSKEGKEFTKILTKYNKDIKDITRINSFLLRSTKEMVENFQKTSRSTGDFSNQKKVQKTMADNLKPLLETLKNEDRKLDATLKELLTEKQYSKWIKYNRRLYKVFPKEKE
ncbi:hypothetical protein [uncultured Polaribacter sp.]|uniref:hypothetical protein n=1 Tax=uncultured Polaribacter sp. TaxID=174711 RepID=UPI0026037C0C|nr:hypothetical protein [uncultured Polaribacter sp.]